MIASLNLRSASAVENGFAENTVPQKLRFDRRIDDSAGTGDQLIPLIPGPGAARGYGLDLLAR